MAPAVLAEKTACKAAGVCVRDGKLLLVRKKGSPWWILPGGKMERMEMPEAALKREFQEELSCGVETGGVIGCFIDDWMERPGVKIVILAFQATLVGTPRASDEIEEFKWFAPEEVLAGESFARGAKAVLKELMS